ncbi:MAG: hypothetical protein Q4E09_05180 [Eubacteriales bacterium]|nr:hypothetical protein [Eubacteriales bacterium]
MFFASKQDKDLLGLRRILEEAPCLSPQGRQLQHQLHFYHSGDREDLEREFATLEQLRQFATSHPVAVRDAENILRRFRPLRLTLAGLAEGRALDATEFFELKRYLSLERQLAFERELWQAAGLMLQDLDAAWQLLNPKGSDQHGFHVYSSYAEDLDELRHEKGRLEKAILASAPEERNLLLEERAQVAAQEAAAENRVLRDLGQEFATYLPALRANLQALAMLDFRLARVKLGERWSSPCPRFLPNGGGVKLEGAKEPWIARKLAAQGHAFTPQDIRMEAGATVITGANMGGKSVALRSILLQLLLVHLGYYPNCSYLELEVFDFFAFTTDNSGDGSLGLSSFGMEAAQMRDQLRLIRHYKGFVVLDEPARGTNPQEARAIVTGLCQIYTGTNSFLLLATHYRISPAKGIRFYQIRGLAATDSAEAAAQAQPPRLPENSPAGQEAPDLTGSEEIWAEQRQKEDLAAAKWIRGKMDYRLRPNDGKSLVPAEALRIAEWMGMDSADIEVMRQAYMEEK